MQGQEARLPCRLRGQHVRVGRVEGHRLAGRRLDAANQRRTRPPAGRLGPAQGNHPAGACGTSSCNSPGSAWRGSIPSSCRTCPAARSKSSWAATCREGQARPDRARSIVTRRQGDRDVRFEQAVSLADAEQGNSFIPRLWARMHLDYLLQQGAVADDQGRHHRSFRRIPHHHALHVAIGPGERRRPRTVQSEAALPHARRREVLRRGPRQRQLRAARSSR